MKAYTTRVGEGPYPTEIHGDLAETLREVGAEYGTTTGRPRRIGWLDIPALQYVTRWVPRSGLSVPLPPILPRCVKCCQRIAVVPQVLSDELATRIDLEKDWRRPRPQGRTGAIFPRASGIISFLIFGSLWRPRHMQHPELEPLPSGPHLLHWLPALHRASCLQRLQTVWLNGTWMI